VFLKSEKSMRLLFFLPGSIDFGRTSVLLVRLILNAPGELAALIIICTPYGRVILQNQMCKFVKEYVKR